MAVCDDHQPDKWLTIFIIKMCHANGLPLIDVVIPFYRVFMIMKFTSAYFTVVIFFTLLYICPSRVALYPFTIKIAKGYELSIICSAIRSGSVMVQLPVFYLKYLDHPRLIQVHTFKIRIQFQYSLKPLHSSMLNNTVAKFSIASACAI